MLILITFPPLAVTRLIEYGVELYCEVRGAPKVDRRF